MPSVRVGKRLILKGFSNEQAEFENKMFDISVAPEPSSKPQPRNLLKWSNVCLTVNWWWMTSSFGKSQGFNKFKSVPLDQSYSQLYDSEPNRLKLQIANFMFIKSEFNCRWKGTSVREMGWVGVWNSICVQQPHGSCFRGSKLIKVPNRTKHMDSKEVLWIKKLGLAHNKRKTVNC